MRYHMHLQKQKTHKVGDKEYYKYVLVVNSSLVDALGWKEGDELEAKVKDKKMVVVGKS